MGWPNEPGDNRPNCFVIDTGAELADARADRATVSTVLFPIAQPGQEIALLVQRQQDIQLLPALHVEDQVRKAQEPP